METISITRGLKELKLLNDRIVRCMRDLKTVDITQEKHKGVTLLSHLSIVEFEKQAKSGHQSLVDLMERKKDIKRAIVLSNATTTVKIGNRELTVSDVIEERSALVIKRQFLEQLRKERKHINTQISNARDGLDKQINEMLTQNLNKDRKADKEDYDRIAKPFMEANELKPLDPLKIAKLVEDLEKEIEDFEANADIVLSESNSRTDIEIK